MTFEENMSLQKMLQRAVNDGRVQQILISFLGEVSCVIHDDISPDDERIEQIEREVHKAKAALFDIPI